MQKAAPAKKPGNRCGARPQFRAGQLPYRFTLDDTVSMSSNDKLSNHAEVMISARVSKSGQAMAQPSCPDGGQDVL